MQSHGIRTAFQLAALVELDSASPVRYEPSDATMGGTNAESYPQCWVEPSGDGGGYQHYIHRLEDLQPHRLRTWRWVAAPLIPRNRTLNFHKLVVLNHLLESDRVIHSCVATLTTTKKKRNQKKRPNKTYVLLGEYSMLSG